MTDYSSIPSGYLHEIRNTIVNYIVKYNQLAYFKQIYEEKIDECVQILQSRKNTIPQTQSTIHRHA